MMRIYTLLLAALCSLFLVACAHQAPVNEAPPKSENPLKLGIDASNESTFSKALENVATLNTQTPLDSFAAGQTEGLIVPGLLSGEELWNIQLKIGAQPVRLFLAALQPAERTASTDEKSASKEKKQSDQEDANAFNGSDSRTKVFYLYINPALTDAGKRLPELWSAHTHDALRDAGLTPLTAALVQRNEVTLKLKEPRVPGGYE